MSDLEVTIRGLVLCRPIVADGVTQMIFPHAPGHMLKLTMTKYDQNDNPVDVIVEKLPVVNTLALTTENGARAITPVDSHGDPLGNDLVDIVDLHNRVLPVPMPPTPSLNLRNRADVKLPMSYFTLPTHILFADAHTNGVFEFWTHKTRATPPSRLREYFPNADRRIPQAVTVKFEILAGSGSLIPAVKLRLQKPFDNLYKFVHDPAYNYQIVLDNHCDGNSCGADFGYYYELLEGRDGNQYQVEMEEFPIKRPLTGGSPDSLAACNPVLGDTKEDLEDWYTVP